MLALTLYALMTVQAYTWEPPHIEPLPAYYELMESKQK